VNGVRRFARGLGTLGFLVAFIVLMGARHPEFADVGRPCATLNIHLSILKQASLIAIVAAGMTMVIILGGIDLSVASLSILTSAVAAGLMVHSGLPAALAFALALLLGLALGATNGVLSSWIGLPPFIATLGMMSVARGAAYLYCKSVAAGTTIYGLPDGARAWNARIPLGGEVSLPVPLLLVAVVYVFAGVILSRTKLGRYTYAIGSNEEVARLAGIPVNIVKTAVYTILGGLCAVAGFIYIGELNSANAEGLPGFELDVIAAVVIGGTSLSGGEGRVAGTLIGSLLIAYIRDGLTREGAGTEWGLLVIGLIIVAAVGFDRMVRKRAGSSVRA
jgi:ribose transport system permease protein